MDLDATVKEAYKSYIPNFDSDTKTITRRFHVEGPDIATSEGPTKAVYHDDILAEQATITFEGDSFEFASKSAQRGDASDTVLVTITYEEISEDSESSGGTSTDRPAQEKARRTTYGVPYNERIEAKTEEGEVYIGKLAAPQANNPGVFSPFKDPKKTLTSNVVWSFDVNVTPFEELYSLTGAINDKPYPPVQYLGDERPFAFEQYTLMYLGAPGSILNVESLDDTDGIPRNWIWKLTPSFGFKPRKFTPDGHDYGGWAKESQWYTEKLKYTGVLGTNHKIPAPQLGLIDPSVKRFVLDAELPIVYEDGNGNLLPTIEMEIPEDYRPRVDFADIFEFDWGQ